VFHVENAVAFGSAEAFPAQDIRAPDIGGLEDGKPVGGGVGGEVIAENGFIFIALVKP
jgi:hypothetical protein